MSDNYEFLIIRLLATIGWAMVFIYILHNYFMPLGWYKVACNLFLAFALTMLVMSIVHALARAIKTTLDKKPWKN